jgi:multiple sugar transport system substrate-binding protein
MLDCRIARKGESGERMIDFLCNDAMKRFALFLPLLALAGCRVPSTSVDGVVELRFWNGFSGPDGKAMEQIVRDFNASQKDIRVKMQIVPWSTYYDKVTLGLASKDAPDVFVLHSHRVPEYATHQALAPMDDFLTESKMGPKDFVPLAWGAGTWQGKRYGLPLDCHPLGMYYNADMFRKAGIEKPPATKEEFLDVAKRLTKDTNGDGRPDQWGFAITDLHLVGSTLFFQYGASLLDKDGKRAALDTPGGRESLRFLRSLVTEYKVAPDTTGDDSWVAFQTGKVGMAFQGIWMIDALERQATFKYAAAPTPILGPEKKVWAGSHILSIPAYLEADRQKAAWTFIRYLSDHSLAWAKGGQVPVRPHILNSKEFQDLRVQREFAKQLGYVQYEPSSPTVNQIATFGDIAVQSVSQGLKTPADALADASTRINRVMERQ